MEAPVVSWGSIGIYRAVEAMEEKMEVTIVSGGYKWRMEKKMETTIVL